MPTKAERIAELPAGLLPLLTQPQLETLYSVSDWTVLQWIRQGMPVEPFAGRQKRFNLAQVRAWMAEYATDEAPVVDARRARDAAVQDADRLSAPPAPEKRPKRTSVAA